MSEPTAKRYCLDCETTFRTGNCFLCGGEGVTGYVPPSGWPLLILPRDWEPAPEPATVLRRARNALNRRTA